MNTQSRVHAKTNYTEDTRKIEDLPKGTAPEEPSTASTRLRTKKMAKMDPGKNMAVYLKEEENTRRSVRPQKKKKKKNRCRKLIK